MQLDKNRNQHCIKCLLLTNPTYNFTFVLGEKLPYVHEAVYAILQAAPGGNPQGKTEIVCNFLAILICQWMAENIKQNCIFSLDIDIFTLFYNIHDGWDGGGAVVYFMTILVITYRIFGKIESLGRYHCNLEFPDLKWRGIDTNIIHAFLTIQTNFMIILVIANRILRKKQRSSG